MRNSEKTPQLSVLKTHRTWNCLVLRCSWL